VVILELVYRRHELAEYLILRIFCIGIDGEYPAILLEIPVYEVIYVDDSCLFPFGFFPYVIKSGVER
jgi:hypothetical protein